MKVVSDQTVLVTKRKYKAEIVDDLVDTQTKMYLARQIWFKSICYLEIYRSKKNIYIYIPA